jgi:hypothetical protein
MPTSNPPPIKNHQAEKNGAYVWTFEVREVLYQLLVRQFGPRSQWQAVKRPGRGLDEAYALFLHDFAKIFAIIQNEKEDQKNRAIKQEQEQVAREQERVACDAKRKASAEADKVNWSVVKAAQIELRDTLLKPRSYGDDYDVVVSAKNRSPAGISRIRMNVVALDCPDDDAGKNKCDVVGHQEKVFEANIPTG